MSKKNISNILLKVVSVLFFGWMFVTLTFALLFPGTIGASQGSHTGVVTAVERNSNLIWGSTIVYVKTLRDSSQEDRYCVNDQNLENQLVNLQKEKKEVTIYFKNEYFMWKWDCNGGESIIYKVE